MSIVQRYARRKNNGENRLITKQDIKKDLNKIYISDKHECIFVSEEINNNISIHGREKKYSNISLKSVI